MHHTPKNKDWEHKFKSVVDFQQSTKGESNSYGFVFQQMFSLSTQKV